LESSSNPAGAVWFARPSVNLAPFRHRAVLSPFAVAAARR
jgi:hypothetical protein